MFKEIGGFDLDPVVMALLGQRAENHFVGVNCGISGSVYIGQWPCRRSLAAGLSPSHQPGSEHAGRLASGHL